MTYLLTVFYNRRDTQNNLAFFFSPLLRLFKKLFGVNKLISEMSEAKKNELKSERVIQTTCKHFVQRRKRFCRMTVAKGQVIQIFVNPTGRR